MVSCNPRLVDADRIITGHLPKLVGKELSEEQSPPCVCEAPAVKNTLSTEGKSKDELIPVDNNAATTLHSVRWPLKERLIIAE